jgi:flagellar hook-length control protein FliK
VASHLTVISTSQSGTTTRALSSGPSAEQQSGVLGLFSSLLGNSTQQGASTTATSGQQSQANVDLSLLGLGRLTLEAGSESEGEAADPEAIAAALDLGMTLTAPVDPEPVVRLIDALSALKVDLAAGKVPDPAMLADAETALQSLADAMGIDLESLPKGLDFSALLDGTAANNGLASLLAPLANALTEEVSVSISATSEGAAGQKLSDRVQALGERIAGLLGQLEQGAISADKLASLGLGPAGKLDAEIEAAIARLSAGIVTDPELVPQEPDLAAPALKLTEAAIAGKGAAAVTVDASAGGDTGSRTGDGDPARKDAKQAGTTSTNQSTTPTAQPTPADTPPVRASEPVQREAVAAPQSPAPDNSVDPSTLPGQQQASAKVDLALAPRVVQAGYQTSQQQLNLPQIAFELARQVNDGNTRFQIRLDPPELGRIDVRLDIDKAGQVNARLTVEKAETLDLMQRDQRGLERAPAAGGHRQRQDQSGILAQAESLCRTEWPAGPGGQWPNRRGR